MIKEKELKILKSAYPEGTRVKLIRMDDRYVKIKPGELGTVTGVDDIGTIHVSWDCGNQLGIVSGEDLCEKI